VKLSLNYGRVKHLNSASEKLLLQELSLLIDDRAGKLAQAHVSEIIAHAIVALMRRAGENASQFLVRNADDGATGIIVCEFERAAQNVLEAAELAIQLIAAALSKDGQFLHRFQQQLRDFTRTGSRRGRLPVNTQYMVRGAIARGIPVNRRSSGPVRLGHGCLQQCIDETVTSKTSRLAMSMTSAKDETLAVLTSAGLPVPQFRIVRSAGAAVRAARELGYPIVVKPLSGNKGNGVSVGLTRAEDVDAAFHEARKFHEKAIVEKLIRGLDYRLLVVNGELAAVCQRIPGHVIGNGVDTVEQLLTKLNAEPARNGGLFKKIALDFDAKRMLSEQGMRLDSVPELERIVYLRSKANTSAGGISVGVTELVHPDNRRIAVAAAQAFRLDVAGIDLIISDISQSYKENGGAICEVNSRPGVVDLHVSPMRGTKVDVPGYILEALFPDGGDGRIPTIAVCGEHGKAQATHAAADLLQMLGHQVGLATHEGIWIAGDLVSKGNFASAAGAERVLWHPLVDAAAMEVSTRSILTEGLGFDLADVVVVTDWPYTDNNRLSALAAAIRSARKAVVFLDEAILPKILLDAAQGRKIIDSRLSGTLGSAFAADASEVVCVPEQDGSVNVSLPEHLRPPQRSVVGAIMAARTLGFSQYEIENALKGLEAERILDHVMITGVRGVPELLLATPRNAIEAKRICDMARRWAQPGSANVLVDMCFAGDQELLLSIENQRTKGFGASFVFKTRPNDESELRRLDEAIHEALSGSRKLLIITDNQEFFRRHVTKLRTAIHREPTNVEQCNLSATRIRSPQLLPELSYSI
jgi:D-alanine-D-alanine ligase-like ATP-grasp enzyme